MCVAVHTVGTRRDPQHRVVILIRRLATEVLGRAKTKGPIGRQSAKSDFYGSSPDSAGPGTGRPRMLRKAVYSLFFTWQPRIAGTQYDDQLTHRGGRARVCGSVTVLCPMLPSCISWWGLCEEREARALRCRRGNSSHGWQDSGRDY